MPQNMQTKLVFMKGVHQVWLCMRHKEPKNLFFLFAGGGEKGEGGGMGDTFNFQLAHFPSLCNFAVVKFVSHFSHLGNIIFLWF